MKSDKQYSDTFIMKIVVLYPWMRTALNPALRGNRNSDWGIISQAQEMRKMVLNFLRRSRLPVEEGVLSFVQRGGG